MELRLLCSDAVIPVNIIGYVPAAERHRIRQAIQPRAQMDLVPSSRLWSTGVKIINVMRLDEYMKTVMYFIGSLFTCF